VLVMPTINTDRGDIEPPPWAHIREVVAVPSSGWLTTMGRGAGFYSDLFGPMPFTFVRVPPEEFAIIAVRPELLGGAQESK
jgi:hypothetical protein